MKISEQKAAELTGLSRATIQRFRGLLSDSKGNKVKILNPKMSGNICYYDEVEMEKLWLIKMMKSLGKSRDEIIKSMSDPNFEKKEFLNSTIEELEKMIEVAKSYINTGIGYEVMDTFGVVEDTNFSEMNKLILIMNDFKEYLLLQGEEIEYEDMDDNNYFTLLYDESVEQIFNKDKDPIGKEIQDYLKKFFTSYFDNKYYVIEIAGYISIIFDALIQDEELEIDREYGAYIQKAIQFFFENFDSTGYEVLKLADLLEKVEKMGYDKKTTNCAEVQLEIDKVYLCYYYLYKSHIAAKEFMKYFIDFINSEGVIEKYDNGNKRGILWFIGRSIEINMQKREVENEIN